MLNPEQRKKLLEIARTTIANALHAGHQEIDESGLDETLKSPSGVFVTLRTRDGELRGCIGSIHPVAPLYRAVEMSAINAAFRDPRFHPLRAEELGGIEIEISVMGPIQPAKPEDVVVGRDGLIVSRGRNAGLLLPQVATEYGWDRATFLAQTCVKAGLPPDSWRASDCRLERFEAEVFSEDAV